MNRSSWIVLSAVALLGVAGWSMLRARTEVTVLDLIDDLPNVVVALPNLEAFSVIDANIAGETKRAIFFTGNSRLAWRLTVPDNAWLSLSLGITEDAWSMEGGDGLLFRVSIYDEDLLNLAVNPIEHATDRRWQEVRIDLSEYAGETLDIYLKTNGPLGGPENRIGDHCVWGEPRVVTR